MTPHGLLLGWLTLGPLILGLAWVCMTVEEWLTNRATKNAAPVQRPTPAPGRATKSCTVPFCDDPVQIHLHVGHDWWTFCMAHGLPYLTDELHREAS